MNPIERIIALDEALDEVIFSRAQRVYDDEMEFRANPEDERRGIGVGGAIGGTAALGAASYGGSLAYRNKRNAAFGDSSIKGVAQGDFNRAAGAVGDTRVGKYAKGARNRFKTTRRVGGSRMRATGNAIKQGGGRQLAGYGKQLAGIPGRFRSAMGRSLNTSARFRGPVGQKLRRGLGALRGKLKFEDEQEAIEFMYDSSGKGWGDEARRQRKVRAKIDSLGRLTPEGMARLKLRKHFGRGPALARRYGKQGAVVGAVAGLGYGLGRIGRKSD